MTIACIVNWSGALIIGFMFPILLDILGPYSFVFFAISIAATFIFVQYHLPETHGRTIEDIQRIARAKSEDLLHILEEVTDRA